MENEPETHTHALIKNDLSLHLLNISAANSTQQKCKLGAVLIEKCLSVKIHL